MDLISIYFLYFIIYSFIGWCLEVFDKFFEFKRFINRGFLIGPICPIYGFSVLFILLLIGDNSNDFLSVFLKSIFICSILEYFTSFTMEKLFKARWWDYSKYKFNINGRICLETTLPFGLLGCVMVYIVHPNIIKLVNIIPYEVRIMITIILLIIFIIDNIISFNVMNKIKNEIKKQTADNTEIIKRKVLEFIDKKSIIYKHIKNAFPKFKIYKKLERFKNDKVD